MPLPDTLRRYKYVDFRQETPAAFGELLAACREESEAVLPAQRETKKKPGRRKPKSAKLAEQAEPLAMLERNLKGHTDWAKSVAVSPDGKWAASGSWDNTAKIWDLETGACRATLVGHTDRVNSVWITPDGKRILSGSVDKTICVWDVSDGKIVAKWQASEYTVYSVVPMSDGRRAISCGDQTSKIWDVVKQQCLISLIGHTSMVRSVAVSKDEKRVVSGSADQTVRFWNLETGECLATLKGHSENVTSVQITEDGRFAVSGSDDKTVKVWDLEAQTCVGTLEGHQAEVLSVAISPDGDLIASAGFTDETIRLWDWKSGSCLQVITNGDNVFPISVAFSPDGSRLLAGTTDAEVSVYRLTGIRAVPSAEPARRYV